MDLIVCSIIARRAEGMAAPLVSRSFPASTAMALSAHQRRPDGGFTIDGEGRATQRENSVKLPQCGTYRNRSAEAGDIVAIT